MAMAEERMLYEENETPIASQSAFDEEIEMILNVDNHGLDDPDLFNVCEESVDVEELMDAEDDEWLLEAVRKSEPQVANPLFSVRRHCLRGKRYWKNGSVIKGRVRLHVHHNLPPHHYLRGEAIAEAFYQNACDYFQHYPLRYPLLMEIHYGKNVLLSSPFLPLEEWINNSEKTQQWIQRLSSYLKSMPKTVLIKEEFSAELTLVKPLYTGCRFLELNDNSFEEFLKKKRCVVDRRHIDTLCCADAIIKSIELIAKGPSFLTAKKLHQYAQVPEKVCGSAELDAFQLYLAPQYQLIVLDGFRGEIVYKNPTYELAKHVIALLKMEEHYHVITSLPAFFKLHVLNVLW